jgi:hypothetical protein
MTTEGRKRQSHVDAYWLTSEQGLSDSGRNAWAPGMVRWIA